MARAKTITQIPLDRVAEVLGLDPLHFNSIVSARRPERFTCDDMWYQHDWQQNGRVSRETLAMVLRQAEDTVASYLGYYLLPKWIVDEQIAIPKPFVQERYSPDSLTARGRYKTLKTKWGYVLYGGVRTKEFVARASIVYSDADGDGYKEVATVTLPTTITDPEEICLYYPGEDGADEWEIRPINVRIDAITSIATITFWRHQVARPELLEKAPAPDDDVLNIDGDDDANFLTEVDVYRVWRDPSRQVVFKTENCRCNTQTCGHYEQTGCLTVRNERLGLVALSPARWDAEQQTFIPTCFCGCGEPDYALVSYRAGLRDLSEKQPTKQMTRQWEYALIHYALTLLDDEVCGCDNFNRIISYNREDLASSGPDRNTHILSMRDLDCPLGTTRAAIRLWKMITAPEARLVTRR